MMGAQTVKEGILELDSQPLREKKGGEGGQLHITENTSLLLCQHRDGSTTVHFNA